MSIVKHEFSDTDVKIIDSTSDLSNIELAVLPDAGGFFYLEKRDVIALAKHFKLTSDDLL